MNASRPLSSNFDAQLAIWSSDLPWVDFAPEVYGSQGGRRKAEGGMKKCGSAVMF